MMRFLFIFCALLLVVPEASARGFAPKLMVSQGFSRTPTARKRRTRKRRRNYIRGRVRYRPKQTKTWGLELGTVARRQSTNTSFLGSHIFLGGNVTASLPLQNRFRIKPALGFYTSHSGAGSVGFHENFVRLGAAAHYTLTETRSIRLYGGINQSLDYRWAVIAADGATEAGGGTLQYRVGPQIGALFPVSRNMGIHVDIDGNISDQFTLHFGLTVGAEFRL